MTWLAIYAAGFVAINVLAWLSLRSEPTDHGRIVGRQIGCAAAVLWPIFVPYIVIVGGGYLAVLGWRKLTGKGEL